MNCPFTTDKSGIVTFLLPEFNFKKQIPWKFHVDGRSKPSDTYGTIIAQDVFGKLGIILNFNNKTVTWDIDTIPMMTTPTLQVLQKYEHLFDGTLRNFTLAPISLNLIDPGSKPINACPFTIPRTVEQ
jgi:hypothetical protein